MRGVERLIAVEKSTPAISSALPALPVAETVMVRLMRISVFGLGQFFEPVFRAMGLTENSFHVLCLLFASENRCAAPSVLSELIGTSRANMTRILDSLVADGLVSRSIEVRDARRHVIRITAAGRKTVTEAVPKLVGPLKRSFSGLSAEERVQLEQLLRKTIVSFDSRAILPRAVA
jgi:MarR family transcriptional repressor of emrRAB